VKYRNSGLLQRQLDFVFTAGLYAESHGMVDNYMYDERHQTEFLIGNNRDQYFSYWWNDAEPLWVTATKHVSRPSPTLPGHISYSAYRAWSWLSKETDDQGSKFYPQNII